MSTTESMVRNYMKAVELFAGIGGFRIACDRLGIDTVWANDIDGLAAQVYKNNFKKGIFKEGDITENIPSIPDHDLLTAGFPCQPFSSAGKKLGTEDIRGTLFEKIVQVLILKKPKYFVLENVKRLLSMDNGEHFSTILEALSKIGYLIEWRLLNSIDFGLPQHRERIIIIGHRNTNPVSYLCNNNELESLSEKTKKNLSNVDSWIDIIKHSKKFLNWGVAINGKFAHANINLFSEAKSKKTLKDILEEHPEKYFFFTEDTLKRIENSEYVNKYYNGVKILYNQKGGARMGYSIFGVDGVAPTLTCTTSRHYERYEINSEFRRLTNIEYARIQGFPDDHCRGVKVYNQYSLYGNAVPPDMVEWAIKKTTSGNPVFFSDLNKDKALSR